MDDYYNTSSSSLGAIDQLMQFYGKTDAQIDVLIRTERSTSMIYSGFTIFVRDDRYSYKSTDLKSNEIKFGMSANKM